MNNGTTNTPARDYERAYTAGGFHYGYLTHETGNALVWILTRLLSGHRLVAVLSEEERAWDLQVDPDLPFGSDHGLTVTFEGGELTIFAGTRRWAFLTHLKDATLTPGKQENAPYVEVDAYRRQVKIYEPGRRLALAASGPDVRDGREPADALG